MNTPLRAVRIEDELWEAAQVEARREGVTVSGLIRQLLKAWIEDQGGTVASNPDIGPRCPACRMGLVTHEPKDPRCIIYVTDV